MFSLCINDGNLSFNQIFDDGLGDSLVLLHSGVTIRVKTNFEIRCSVIH